MNKWLGPLERACLDRRTGPFFFLSVAPGDRTLELRRNYLDKDGAGQIITFSILPAQHSSYDIILRRQA